MKKILFLTIGFVYGFSCYAQQITINKWINVTIPNGADKLTKEQLIVFGKQIGYPTAAIEGRPQNVYNSEGILIGLFDFESDTPNRYNLQDYKKDRDNMYTTGELRRKTGYSSIMKTINGNKVLETKSINKNSIDCSFTIVNPDGTIQLNGILIYKKSDEDKGDALLNSLVSSVAFNK